MHPAEPFSTDDRGRVLFIILASLFCITGAVYSLMWLGDAIRFPDERDYLELASHAAALNGFTYDGETPTALRPPGYPFALVPVVAVFDSIHAVRIVQFLLLVLASWWLGSLANKASGESAWRCASFILLGVVAYPVLVYTAGTVFPQTLLLVLLTALIVQLVHSGNSLWRAALVGLLAAIIAEVSPTALVALPGALAFALWSPQWSGSRVIIMALCVVLALGTWVTRNVFVIGEPILFSQNLAHNIDNAVLTLDPLEPDEERDPDDTLGYGIDRLAQYAEDPELYVRHFLDFFAYRNELMVEEESTSRRDVIMFFSYHSLLLLVLLRLLMAHRRPLSQAEWFVLGLYVATALFHALVIPRIRYRLPFDFLLLLPAVNAMLIGWRWRLNLRRRYS